MAQLLATLHCPEGGARSAERERSVSRGSSEKPMSVHSVCGQQDDTPLKTNLQRSGWTVRFHGLFSKPCVDPSTQSMQANDGVCTHRKHPGCYQGQRFAKNIEQRNVVMGQEISMITLAIVLPYVTLQKHSVTG